MSRCSSISLRKLGPHELIIENMIWCLFTPLGFRVKPMAVVALWFWSVNHLLVAIFEFSSFGLIWLAGASQQGMRNGMTHINHPTGTGLVVSFIREFSGSFHPLPLSQPARDSFCVRLAGFMVVVGNIFSILRKLC